MAERRAEDALQRWWTARAEDFRSQWFGPDQGELFRGVDRELELLDALIEAVEPRSGTPAAGEVALVVARLWPLWTARHREAYARGHLDLLAPHGTSSGDPAADVEIAWARSWLSITSSRLDDAAASAADLRALAEAGADPAADAAHAQIRGVVELYRGRIDESRRLLERAAAAHSAQGAPAALAIDLSFLASGCVLAGDPDGGAEFRDRAIEVGRAHGDQWLGNYLRWASAVSVWEAGDRRRAEALAIEGVAVAAETGDRYAAATYLEVLGDFESESGRPTRAAALLGASTRIWRSVDSQRDLWNSSTSRRRAVDRLEAQLDPGAFRRAFEAGSDLAVDAAGWVALASADEAASATLSPRQSEVAALVAEGRTNKEIATALGIAERTVEMHVAGVFGRLGVRSRSQIAAWVAARESSPRRT